MKDERDDGKITFGEEEIKDVQDLCKQKIEQLDLYGMDLRVNETNYYM